MIIEEIAEYISGLALGDWDPDDAGGNIFLEEMPPDPDDAICLYSTGGGRSDAKTTVKRPGAQVIVRGVDLAETMTRAKSIHDALNDPTIRGFTSGGTRVMLCQCTTTEPVHMGTDDNGRHQYTSEVTIISGGD